MSFAVWLTGLPACGKSAIARELLRLLHAKSVDAAVLESDVMRTQLTPFPRYDEADRHFFYGTLAEIGILLTRVGRSVVFDATANRRRYRDAALELERHRGQREHHHRQSDQRQLVPPAEAHDVAGQRRWQHCGQTHRRVRRYEMISSAACPGVSRSPLRTSSARTGGS